MWPSANALDALEWRDGIATGAAFPQVRLSFGLDLRCTLHGLPTLRGPVRCGATVPLGEGRHEPESPCTSSLAALVHLLWWELGRSLRDIRLYGTVHQG